MFLLITFSVLIRVRIEVSGARIDETTLSGRINVKDVSVIGSENSTFLFTWITTGVSLFWSTSPLVLA